MENSVQNPVDPPVSEVSQSSVNPAKYHSTEDWQSTIESAPIKPITPVAQHSLSPAQAKMVMTLVRSTGNSQDLMFSPYKRIFVMHVTIILGGFLSQIVGNQKAAVVVMIALKIAADLFSHANYHGLGNANKPQGGI
jgi:hypothetical protein